MMNIDYEAWRCCYDDTLFCPDEGCPKMFVGAGGEFVLYGCARARGWHPGEPSPPECVGCAQEEPPP